MNAVWAFFLCGSVNKDGTNACRSDLSTYDGIKPFTSGTDQTNYDVSTPNPTYWARVDSYIEDAATRGVQVFFLTWETPRLMPLATFNGNTKMFNFGVFLGNRYKNFPNIVWWTGNDFQTWTTGLKTGTSNVATAAANNAAMQNLMADIASVDTNHLHVLELNYDVSASADDSGLATYTTVEGLYDYFLPYSKAYTDYNNVSRPLFFDEGFYEYGVYGKTAFDGSTTSISYTPGSTTPTLALSKFSSQVMARWFDPTNGTYQTASGSPFANSGTHNFATPGNNSAGDSDWR